MNVSSPHDLLVSVQYWWEEKVLGPSPAKSHLFFSSPKKNFVCGNGRVSVVDFLLCRWVVQLYFPRVLLNSSTTCTECRLALTLMNVCHVQLVWWGLCDGLASVGSLFLALTGREAIVAKACRFWPCALSHLVLGLRFPQGGSANDCLKPPWLLSTTDNSCFLCTECVRLACRRPTLILCFASVRLNLSFNHTVSWALVYIFEQGKSVWDFRV